MTWLAITGLMWACLAVGCAFGYGLRAMMEQHGDDEALCDAYWRGVAETLAAKDGSRKDYWLRVPPAMRTAREAVAWTFGKDSKDYHPARET